MLTRRLLTVSGSAFALSACINPSLARPEPIALGYGVNLTLPPLPGFPETGRLTQLISTTIGDTTHHIQTALTLSPKKVTAVFSLPGGPPAMSVRWSAQGIAEHRENFVPKNLDARRILGDIFLSHWPIARVQKQLSGGNISETDVKRLVSAADGRKVITIQTIRTGERTHLALDNEAQGYTLAIISRPQVP